MKNRKQVLSSCCQSQWPWPTPEKTLSAELLETVYLVTDSRGRNAEFICGKLEASVTGRSLEDPQGDQRWQPEHLLSVDELNSPATHFFEFALFARE
jgi:hypothetical protein